MTLLLQEEDSIAASLEYAEQNDFDQPLRIVAGLCFELAKRQRGQTQSEWHSLPKRQAPTPDTRAITDESQICTVVSEYTLTPEMRTALTRKYIHREAGFEMPAGFVEAYYRRKKGTGHDPDAPRIEHVHSYKRGFDRLLDGTLPGGSQGNVN